MFLPPQKPTFTTFNPILECRSISNQFLWTPGAPWVNKLQLHLLLILHLQWKETSSQSKFWLQTWRVRSVEFNSRYIYIYINIYVNREVNLAFFPSNRKSSWVSPVYDWFCSELWQAAFCATFLQRENPIQCRRVSWLGHLSQDRSLLPSRRSIFPSP